MTISSYPALSRRNLLASIAGLVPASVIGLSAGRLLAQETGGAAPAAPQQFSFDLLSEEMRQLATTPQAVATAPEGFLGDLDYDSYRLIQFREDAARWSDTTTPYRLYAFHMGWLFPEPVRQFDITDGLITEMQFSTDDFEYLNDLAAAVPAHATLPGVAGFKLTMPLNRPDMRDELAAFLGASYFRALGRGNAYGLSSRGLALNTATEDPEEFPRFSRFYIARDPDGGNVITIYATLDGPSVTGAYRMVIIPGADTVMEITARLFFRQDVTELGIAPLTSMFLFSENNRADFDDFRPNVHDSDGLMIRHANGEVIWRPLNNPKQLATSYFAEVSPVSFGLHQRDRDFNSYQDIGAHYQIRPSLDMEPVGDWGKGMVRLVEIPSLLEGNDNIVAYWVPDAPAKAGDAREFAYNLRWGMLPVDPVSERAHVSETRSGIGGVSGVETTADNRKFVIDFKGGMLATLPADAALFPDGGTAEDADLRAMVTIGNGTLAGTTLDKIPDTDIWRVVLDITAAAGATVELSLHIAGYDRKLTENWLYQWSNL